MKYMNLRRFNLQLFAEGRVGGEGVAQVGEPSMRGFYASGQFEGLLQRKVRMVRMIAYRIER